MEEVHYRTFIMVNMSVLLCGCLVRRYMCMCDFMFTELHTGFGAGGEGGGGGGGGIELPKILRGQGNAYRCTESCTIVSSAMWRGGVL